MEPSTVEELLGLAAACGAADFGGSLSRAELAALRRAVVAPSSEAQRLRRLISEGEDPLGEALCAIRPARQRRKVGAFYTSGPIVEAMVSWALDWRPERLVDPGCGSGRFSAAAVRFRRDLPIVAVDCDPVATLLTRAMLAALGASHARVLNADYLRTRIPRIDGRTAFVGNPPYVRHHDLNAVTKRRVVELARARGLRISGLAGLHALFYLATLARHGARDDVGSFVTSAEWLDVGYGSVVRDAFTDGLGGRSILAFDPASVPFDDAMTTAAITTFRIGAAREKVRLWRLAGVTSTFALENEGEVVSVSVLREAPRWSARFRPPESSTASRTLGSLFRVSRGQVTGANAYFTMTREQARARGIEEFCVPVISSADEVLAAGGVLRDDERRRVALAITAAASLVDHPRLAVYLRAGESANVHRGYIAAHRSPWYSIRFPRPPIVMTYMARQAPAFALNPDGLRPLNVVHGLHPREPLSAECLAEIVVALNAARASFVGCGRTYHGGLEKFEPREAEALPLPRELDVLA